MLQCCADQLLPSCDLSVTKARVTAASVPLMSQLASRESILCKPGSPLRRQLAMTDSGPDAKSQTLERLHRAHYRAAEEEGYVRFQSAGLSDTAFS